MKMVLQKEDIYQYLLNTYLMKQDDDVVKKINGLKKAKNFMEWLKDKDIIYKLCVKHPETKGCVQSKEYYQRYSDYLKFDYSICKHLLLRERKGKKDIYLIIVDMDKKVDLYKLKELLECKKFEFVNEVDLKELLDTTPGNISVFSLISDKEKKVKLLIDSKLLEKESLAFHPLYNGMTLFIEPKEVIKFLKDIKEDVIILDIPEKEKEDSMKVYLHT